MKGKETNTKILRRFLRRHFTPSEEQAQAAGDRVLQRLHAKDSGTCECAALEPGSPNRMEPRPNRWLRTAALAAAAVMLLIVSAILWRPDRRDVVASSVDGRQYAAGQLFRSKDGKNDVLTLDDGSRVEIRSGSEAAVERASDGLRVRLNGGSIIVNAAKQASGRHLYVSTRDVLVSVVGTVFLVKSDEQGSSVAVIQGEVHVKQGSVDKELRRGEQASSRSKSELEIALEIGWSREAAAYLAMLHQEIAQSVAARQAAPPTPIQAEVPKTPQFEEASIKPCPKDFQAPEGARGGGSGSMRLSPGRLDALCMTVATLIRTAYRPLQNNSAFPGTPESEAILKPDMTYGLGREDGTRVRGGPDWIRSEKYTIAAVTGSPTDARTIQNVMLKALLESRFQLRTHIEVEQIPVFALNIAKGGFKMKRAGPADCVVPPPAGPGFVDLDERRREYDSVRRGGTPICGGRIYDIGPNVVNIGGAVPFGSLVNFLTLASVSPFSWIAEETNGLLIVNKTGIPDTDTFNYFVEYAADEEAHARTVPPEFLNRNTDVRRAPNVFEALEKQLGLKLERAQGSREYITIDHIERPSPN
jgi:uncharacterized protein (TIGR03435 family)